MVRPLLAIPLSILFAAAAAPAIFATPAFFATEALALDLNSFRAQHKLPPLSPSAALSGMAYSHAADMAARRTLDHKGFRERMVGSAGAENVAYGCANEDCAYRMWAKSAGHRRNMLMKGVSSYGIASATASDGRRYWALELGN